MNMSKSLTEAEKLCALHQYAEAETAYTQYLKDKPDADISAKLGFVQLKQKKYYDAINSFSDAAAGNPLNPEYFDNLGDVFAVVHQFDDARQMYERAAALSGKSDYQLKSGDMAFAAGEIGDALAIYIRELEGEPENPDIYQRIAAVLEKQGKVSEAQAARDKELQYRQKQTESKPSADSWFAYGNLQLSLRNFQEAERGFLESLTYEKRAHTYLCLGETQILLNKDADAAFENAASADPLDFDILVETGDVLTKHAKYDTAITYYTQALGLRNVNADTWVAIAYALYKSGNTEDAQAFYEMAKASAAVRELPWADKMHKSAKTDELDTVF